MLNYYNPLYIPYKIIWFAIILSVTWSHSHITLVANSERNLYSRKNDFCASALQIKFNSSLLQCKQKCATVLYKTASISKMLLVC